MSDRKSDGTWLTQSNVSKQLGDITDAFIERWNNISSQSLTIDEFEAAKKQLTDDFPDVDEYMKANIWKVQDRFVFCLTKSITTFGMKSTQRVEGKNAKLKRALDIDSSSELVGTAGKLITSVTEEQQRKIDDDRKLIQQPNSHSLSSWSWKMKTICTPMAVAWIRKESELEENYTVVGPNVMHQFIMQPANHVRDEYHSMLESLTNEQRQQMFAAAITQE